MATLTSDVPAACTARHTHQQNTYKYTHTHTKVGAMIKVCRHEVSSNEKVLSAAQPKQTNNYTHQQVFLSGRIHSNQCTHAKLVRLGFMVSVGCFAGSQSSHNPSLMLALQELEVAKIPPRPCSSAFRGSLVPSTSCRSRGSVQSWQSCSRQSALSALGVRIVPSQSRTLSA